MLGVAFDNQGELYALETSAGVTGQEPPVVPFSGRVVRVTSTGLVPVATGLMFPTAMTFGPDGKLYVSNFGFGGKPGDGQIVRVDVTQPLAAAAAQTPTALPKTGGPGLDIAGTAFLLVSSSVLTIGWWLRRRVGKN